MPARVCFHRIIVWSSVYRQQYKCVVSAQPRQAAAAAASSKKEQNQPNVRSKETSRKKNQWEAIVERVREEEKTRTWEQTTHISRRRLPIMMPIHMYECKVTSRVLLLGSPRQSASTRHGTACAHNIKRMFTVPVRVVCLSQFRMKSVEHTYMNQME